MIHEIAYTICLLGALVFNPIQTSGQIVDRSVIANSYHSQGLQGEWVLGETIIADFHGAAHELSSGFLIGESNSISTRAVKHSAYSLEIFPNPCSDQIHVQHDFPGVVIIEIIDLQGHRQIRQRLPDHSINLGVSHLPIGPYLLRYHSSSSDGGIYLVIKTK